MISLKGWIGNPIVSGGRDASGYLQVPFIAKIGLVSREREKISFRYPYAAEVFANKFPQNPLGFEPEFSGLRDKKITILIHA